MRDAPNLIKADKEQYDKEFLAVRTTSEDDFKKLSDLVKEIQTVGHKTKRVPQALPLKPYQRVLRVFLLMNPWPPEHAPPPRQAEEDIDRLFAAADRLNPLLQSRAAQWAARFPTPAEFRPPTYAPTKHVQRALEKVFCSYALDASRLTDLCRTTIVFDSIADIYQCLAEIAADNVGIWQIKERLSEPPETCASGYRDLNLLITLEDDGTIAAGQHGLLPGERDFNLSRHICEVQLAYRKFYEVKVGTEGMGAYEPSLPKKFESQREGFRFKTYPPGGPMETGYYKETGHDRYVQWRDIVHA